MEPLRPTGPVIRSRSAMKSEVLPARVQRCRVITVNTRDFTVDVRQEFQPYAAMFDIPFGTPYCHQNQGEGINYMPEIGSTCWVCQPSEEGRDGFVLSFTMVDEGASYRGGRELLNPGDLHFSTRDGNFVFIRRGGVVQIGSTAVCQRIFIPIRNTIQDVAENYILQTPGGDLTWLVARTEEQGDGHQGTTFTLAAKEFSDDPNKDPIALLKIGSHGEGNPTILSLATRDKGGGVLKTSLEITKDGELKWKVQKHTLTVEGDFTATVKGKMTLNADQDISLISKTNALLQGANAALVGGAVQMAVGGGGAGVSGTTPGTPFKLSDDAQFPGVRWSPDFLTWVMAVTAALGGTPGSPAVMIGPALIPPTQHINLKVKL
jgi:hypothetical protein